MSLRNKILKQLDGSEYESNPKTYCEDSFSGLLVYLEDLDKTYKLSKNDLLNLYYTDKEFSECSSCTEDGDIIYYISKETQIHEMKIYGYS